MKRPLLVLSTILGVVIILAMQLGKIARTGPPSAPGITQVPTTVDQPAAEKPSAEPKKPVSNSQRQPNVVIVFDDPASRDEALAAAKTFFGRTTKDCAAGYEIGSGPLGTPVAYKKSGDPVVRMEIVTPSYRADGVEWRASSYIPVLVYVGIVWNGLIRDGAWKYPEERGGRIMNSGVLIEKKNGKITYNGRALEEYGNVAIQCQNLVLPKLDGRN